MRSVVYQEPTREAVQLPPKKRLLIDAIKLPEANAALDSFGKERPPSPDRVMIPAWVGNLSSYCRGYDDIDRMEADVYRLINTRMRQWQHNMDKRDTDIAADERRASASWVVAPPAASFHYYDRPVV